MKKIFLFFITLSSSFLCFSQTEQEGWIDPAVSQFRSTNSSEKIITFDALKSDADNYELPYLRYCIKKTTDFRALSYGMGLVSAGSLIYHTRFSDEIIGINNEKKITAAHVGYIFAAGSALSLFVSEYWFSKASIVPAISENGLGVNIRLTKK